MNKTRRPQRRPARRLLGLDRPVVIGHRGFRAMAPENTILSFELAKKCGVDLVEFDYHQTADGVPVVIHDATLDRTTDAAARLGAKGIKVATRTFAELRILDAASWHTPGLEGVSLPGVEEAIEAILPASLPLIERKGGDAATLARMLKRRDWINHVVVIAFDWGFLKTLRELALDQVLGALGPQPEGVKGRAEKLTTRALDRILRMGIELVVWNNKVDRDVVAAAHDRGMRVWIYTVNDPEEADRLCDLGVDGLISDNPALMWRTLALRA